MSRQGDTLIEDVPKGDMVMGQPVQVSVEEGPQQDDMMRNQITENRKQKVGLV